MTASEPKLGYPLGPPRAARSSALPDYVNAVNMQLSPWDFTFQFNHLYRVVDEDGDIDPQVQAEVVARLVMSPQHAKAFLKIIAEQIEKWEQIFGEIQDLIDPEKQE